MQKYTRLATNNDLISIMKIIDNANEFLKKSGSTQWQNSYPDEESILEDIKNKSGYVFIVENKVAAYAAVIIGIEPTYQEINGAWKNELEDYATIHRICFSSDFQGQGLGKMFLSNIISLKYGQGISNFRVDTHKLNASMQALATHNGFEYRGIIQCNEDKDPARLAYELNL